MSREFVITLSIGESGSPPSFNLHVFVDGEVVAGNQSLSPDESKAVREVSRRYNGLFEQCYRPQVAAEELNTLGTDLFNLWLSRSWDDVKDKVPVGAGARRLLVIASDVSDVLNLPWELLRPPEGDFLGIDLKFSIRRLPSSGSELPQFQGELRPRPLRLLFMACAPQDQASLDYELEEEYLLGAISGLDVAFDSGDLGTFEELCDRINVFRPHIVHLTGHGVVGKKCPVCGKVNGPKDDVCRRLDCKASLEKVPSLGYFAFEDESGRADLRS
ncbi:MAG: CHAT domain-containing protein, partial [Methanotrichaceae archaeon]